jgi:putative multiple sugar transport system permease protein
MKALRRIAISSGHIDLSVGSVAGFVGAVAAVLMVHYHVAYPLAFLALPAGRCADRRRTGLLGRLFQDSVFHRHAGRHAGFQWACARNSAGPVGRTVPSDLSEAFLGLHPELFPATGILNPTSLLIGAVLALVLVYAGAKSRARQQSHGIEVEPYGFFVAKSAVLFSAVVYFTYLIASHRGLPNVLVIMMVLIVLYGFVTTRTVVGRQVYAIGGNAKAASLSGIKTERLTFLTFVNMGVLAALAGLVFAARLNTATPKAGTGFVTAGVIPRVFGGTSW